MLIRIQINCIMYKLNYKSIFYICYLKLWICNFWKNGKCFNSYYHLYVIY